MSVAPSKESGTITGKDDLIAYMASGCKPKTAWRIGTEHEKFAYCTQTFKAVPYTGEQGIHAFFQGMIQEFNWQPILENGQPIALSKGDAAISLEPGGQVELSGGLLSTIHQTCNEVHTHLHEVKTIGARLGIDFLGMGFHPHWSREQISWMPKQRYDIMRAYMPKKGNLGLDMMLRTCTIQVNLDFASEADMVQKFRVSLALQPIATALFANSPFLEGKKNGYKSYRSHIWTDTDPDRCGLLPFVFEDGMGFERYVDYMLDVPMYFVYRNGTYIDASGQSFRDFMAGDLQAYPGHLPRISDWTDHLSTAFPEVRLKKFLEMRGADGGPWQRICALPALWVGLLYDDEALQAAADLISTWTIAEISALRDAVPAQGLQTPFRNTTVQQLALQVLEIARTGLRNRGHLSRSGNDEGVYLNGLQEFTEGGMTPAEAIMKDYHGDMAALVRTQTY